MYKPPIDIIVSDIHTEMVRKQEEAIYQAVLKHDIVVDKEELIKALKYDRHQYEKGFADAINFLVRCKDCVYYKFDNGCPLHESGYFKNGKMLPLENDFCSYGERR